MKTVMKLLIQLCFSLAIITGPALAVAGDDHERAKQLLDAGDILPLEVILQKARTLHPGKVLEVELETEHRHAVYEIELLTGEGKVMKLKLDAKSGEPLSENNED